MTQAHRWIVKWSRTLHVYLTLFGFGLLLFFALTGFMLNHEDWFLPQQSTRGKFPTELLGSPLERHREAIIDKLRTDFGVSGETSAFEIDADNDAYRVTFRSDDGDNLAIIRRFDGETEVKRDKNGARELIVEGKMPLELLVPEDVSKQLPIVEKLRKDFAVRGEVNSPPRYEKESESFSVNFKSPGYLATVTIRASDGHTRVTHRSSGLASIFLDLHRGKDSGPAWSFVIDGVSILFVIVSITGLILWSSLRGRAQHGFAVLMLGAAISLLIYFVMVPR